MTKNDYRELMQGIMQMQIHYIEEEREYEESEYEQGKVAGLRIAIEKLKDSAFLTERED